MKTEPEKDAAQQGRAAQQGTSGTVLGADTATQEWQIAYEGDVSIRCAAVAENGLYVGGFTTDGQARVEYLSYGSGTPETFLKILQKTERSTVCASHRTEVSMRHYADWHFRERNMAGCL